jgi:hypothetical protein
MFDPVWRLNLTATRRLLKRYLHGMHGMDCYAEYLDFSIKN